jgi:hypothetical protein
MGILRSVKLFLAIIIAALFATTATQSAALGSTRPILMVIDAKIFGAAAE